MEIYGVYRAGLLINTIVEQGSVKSIWAKITATKAATLAQATYNKVLMMNPYVLAGAAVVSLGIAMWTLADNTSIAEKAQERFNKKQEEAAKQEQERRQKIESLSKALVILLWLICSVGKVWQNYAKNTQRYLPSMILKQSNWLTFLS